MNKNIIKGKIILLKQKLKDTDYITLKYIEGDLTATEYSTIKNQRKLWRAEINKLEQELKA